MKKIISIISICAVSLVFAATISNAARPVRATLFVSPANPVVGDQLVFSGCGYTPGLGVEVEFTSPTATGYFSGGLADSNGCFNSSPYETLYASDAGDWDVYTAQYQKGNHTWKALADLDFTVAP